MAGAPIASSTAPPRGANGQPNAVSSSSSYASLDRQALDAYAAEYSGRTKIQRLVYLAQHLPDPAAAAGDHDGMHVERDGGGVVAGASSAVAGPSTRRLTSLKRQALRLALPTIQNETMDVALYEECVEMIERMDEEARGGGGPSPGEHGEDERAGAQTAPAAGGADDQDDDDDGSGDPSAATTITMDERWLSDTAVKAKRELEKLEVEMKTYSTNMIKESIRLTHHSLATALIQTGDLQGAVKNYVKARDFNSTAAHELDASMGIIEVTLLTRQYHQTLPAIVKAEYAIQRMAAKGAPIPVGPGAAAARAAAQEDLGEGLVASVLGGGGGGLGGPLRTVETGAESRERQRRARELDELGQRMAFRLRAAKGVALMGLGQYESAAREFIGLEGTLGDWEGRVLSASDLTIYAILTSMATLSRSALRSEVLENKTMRQLIDLGNARYAVDALVAFVDARYDKVLGNLHGNAWRHELDPHLRAHIAPLTTAIRQRAIAQYLEPYGSVQLSRMAQALGMPAQDEPALRQEIVALISSGRLKVRLDTIDGTVLAHRPDERKALFASVLANGDAIESGSRKALLHMQLVQAGINVEAPKAQQQPQQQQQQSERPVRQGGGSTANPVSVGDSESEGVADEPVVIQ